MSESELVGKISEYYENEAPKALRKLIEDGGKKDMLDPTYPYDDRMGRMTMRTHWNRCKSSWSKCRTGLCAPAPELS